MTRHPRSPPLACLNQCGRKARHLMTLWIAGAKRLQINWMTWPIRCAAMLCLSVAVPAAAADPAPFELPGPSLRIMVSRGTQSLPITQLPSLADGDKLTVEPLLPADQGVRFILVGAFLRGATNPPPKNWVHFAETWAKKAKDRNLDLVVPPGARQMVMFLVPDTGGAEGTLVDAVRGKPGEFVRATQDLNQASLDRSRLDAFISAIKAQENSHPEYLRTLAPVLARSLSIKLNEDCLSKVIEMQAACLLENRESLVLADVHTSSMAETLTGAPTDLALQLSATREAGYGFYSPYIAVVRDVARIFGAFSNPDFGYLPTLNVRKGDDMALLLNSAPSFTKPKSVMVIAMPAIEADSPPRLRKGEGGAICLAQRGAVLPVEGAPLIYSTDYARDMTLTVKSASGEMLDLSVTARADRGGYVVPGDAAWPASFRGAMQGHLHGRWGFDRFEGPDFEVQMPDGQGWQLAGDPPTLVVGRENELLLKGGAPACVESVTLRQNDGAARSLSWKAQGREGVAVTLPLSNDRPGPIRIEVKYQGVADPSVLSLRSYAEASRLDGLLLHAGDRTATLSGQRLDQVDRVELAGLTWRPDGLSRDGKVDRLQLVAEGEGGLPAAGAQATAKVRLRDGRAMKLDLAIAPARLQIRLLGKTVTQGSVPANEKALGIEGDGLLPDNGTLVFSVQMAGDGRLSAGDAIEVSGSDPDAVVTLSVGKGLRLESPQIAVATLDPKAAASLLFGPLRVRLRRGEEASDWQPLVTLARLPHIDAVACGAGEGCSIRGRDLFLIEAIGTTSSLDQATKVAHGYTGSTLTTAVPKDAVLYVQLRDAPDRVLRLPIG